MPSKAQLRRALRHGRVSGSRPLGHGGARGNGAHLSSKETTTENGLLRKESELQKARLNSKLRSKL